MIRKKHQALWQQGYEAGKIEGARVESLRHYYHPPSRRPIEDDFVASKLKKVNYFLKCEQDLTAELRKQNQFLQDRIDQLIATGR